MVYNMVCSKDVITKIGRHFRTAYTLGFTERWSVQINDFDYEFGTMVQMVYPFVGSEDNVNLSRAQKEVLLWHWKLGIA